MWVGKRKVTVKGPRGVLSKSFTHMDVEIQKSKNGKSVKVVRHFGTRKNVAAVRTVCSHISNLITGVTKGYEYKMRLVYSHFPIGVDIEKDQTKITIGNFLGDKRKRVIPIIDGVTIEQTDPTKVKDELVISGNSIDDVSLTCSRIKGACNIRKKDIRKFLDGIYVSEKGLLVKEE